MKAQAEQYVILDAQMKNSLETALDIAGNFVEILEKATPNQKNELLHLLLEDCILNNGHLNYKIRKPFDVLLFNPEDKSWLDINPENLPQYKNLANEVKCLTI